MGPSLDITALRISVLETRATTTTFLALGVALAVLAVGWGVRRRRARAHLPPGPPADPIVGHYRIFPRTYQAEHFFEWSKTYGERRRRVALRPPGPIGVADGARAQETCSTSRSSGARSSS